MPQEHVQSTIPFLKIWRQELTAITGPERSAALLADAQTEYDVMLARETFPPNKALKKHVHDFILPGTAMYRALVSAGYERQEAATTVLSLFEAAFNRRRSLMSLLGRLPFAFALFKALSRISMKNMLPAEGWDIEWRDEGPDCLAYDISRCFYMDWTNRLDAAELMLVFCDCDDFVFNALAPKIIWKRTKTLCRGGDVCDFRFYRGNAGYRE